MIKIDGSYGEGGGQIIRTALALSTALQKPFEADSIRHGRSQPGLKAQHLACLSALKQMCNAKFSDVEIGSESLRYIPGEVKARKVEADIGTAGSITLLLQSLLVPCFVASHTITLKVSGGTSGKGQMPFEYFQNVFVPQLKRYGDISARLSKRGYYPQGGGSVEIRVVPRLNLQSIGAGSAKKISILSRGTLAQIKGISHASKSLQNARVAERQADAAKSSLADTGVNVDIRAEYCDTLSPGSGITLWAVFSKANEPTELDPCILGADMIGEKGKPAENVGSEAAKMLLAEISSGAPVDEHLADNLIPFLALFGGSIKVSRISSHTLTNIYAAECFLGKVFSINEKENIIECNP